MRKKKPPAPPPGAPLWMLTYGDMVTLVLTFFILLFSFSTIDNEKFKAIVASFQYALPGGAGVLSEGVNPVIDNAAKISSGTGGGSEKEEQELNELRERIAEMVKKENLTGTVTVTVDERGLMIRFLDGVLFDKGKAELKPEAKKILDKIAVILREEKRPIRVEGHTDNLPIHTPEFPSNLELSVARSVAVTRYLIEHNNVSPNLLGAMGYSEYRPVVPNTSEANRRLNRRVDIVILRSSASTGEPR